MTTSKRVFCQGIKFYDPQIVGDTPETVEYRGLHNLVTRLRQHVGLRDGQLLFAADGSVSLDMSHSATSSQAMHATFLTLCSLRLSYVRKQAIAMQRGMRAGCCKGVWVTGRCGHGRPQ